MAEQSPQASDPLIDKSQPEVETLQVFDDRLHPSSDVLLTPEVKTKKHGRPSWVMCYHDILPGKGAAVNAKQFSDLIVLANDWLKKNVDKQVRWCEAVWWTSPKLNTTDTEYMIVSRRWAECCDSYNIRGLRLWLVPATDDGRNRKLYYSSIQADSKDDTRDSLLNKLNEQLRDGRIKGSILNIETIACPVQDGVANTETLIWSDSGRDTVDECWKLSVYYTDDGTPPTTLAVRDMLPRSTADGFESFEILMQRVNDWITQHNDIDVISIQSFLVGRIIGDSAQPGFQCYYTWPAVRDAHTADFFRIVRIFSCKSSAPSNINSKGLAIENFSPKLVMSRDVSGSALERAEHMCETFHRLCIYLETSKVNVVSMETIIIPVGVQDNSEHEAPDMEFKMLFCLRMYIRDDPALHHHKSQRKGSKRRHGSFRNSNKPSNSKKTTTENDRPGPIFLANVVNRQYKYRWVLVGVVAFIVMSAIVVLSVVYSNV